jgi:hypothetical protein
MTILVLYLIICDVFAAILTVFLKKEKQGQPVLFLSSRQLLVYIKRTIPIITNNANANKSQ